ncbi:MAG: glycosyltransferase family 4 protein [Sedimenticola sp.]
MKILVLTKRFYTGRDLLSDRYGRMWELPYFLAESGHEVRGFALSYRATEEMHLEREGGMNLGWQSMSIGLLPGIGLFRYWQEVKSCISDFKPDLIWAGSDVFHVIMGARLGSIFGVQVVADLYDNYESFSATRLLPGAGWLFRRSLVSVTGISCVSGILARKIANQLPTEPKITVVENGVDPESFRPMSKATCRHRLGLPKEGWLVGVAGALSASRGIAVLGDACLLLQQEGVPVHLVVAGPRDRNFHPPMSGEGFDLGILAHKDVPLFINALDVVVIANIDSEFGRYCFPVKLYETMACGVPLVAASVGAVAELFSDEQYCLFQPGDIDGLARVIKAQLYGPARPNLPVSSWREMAHKLEAFLEDVVASSPMSKSE